MMRKQAAALLLALTLLGGAVTLAVSGGTSGDPLVSKSYVDGTYVPALTARAEERAAKRHEETYAAAADRLEAEADLYAARAGVLTGEGSYHAAFTDIRLKQGDVVQVSAGSGFLLLAGEASLSCSSGKVLALSNGWEKSTGALTLERRYLAVENTVAAVTVTAPTAVRSLEGFYRLTGSGATDYNALADAMKALGLFKGSDTAYGSGYDLEQPPTRIQGLIMFLRLLGEEETALATTAQNPFADVPAWAGPYAAYAYEKGYTKGVDSAARLFGTDSAIKAEEYMTFVLRALGYRDSGESPDFIWDASLQKAQELGVLTPGEYRLLAESRFLRAQVVYVSYFALDAAYKEGGTLLARLESSGTLDPDAVRQVRSGVTVSRLN